MVNRVKGGAKEYGKCLACCVKADIRSAYKEGRDVDSNMISTCTCMYLDVCARNCQFSSLD